MICKVGDPETFSDKGNLDFLGHNLVRSPRCYRGQLSFLLDTNVTHNERNVNERDTNGENFSTRIRKLSEGKSLRAFAAELGISHAALSNYLKGRKPKILELQKISKATGKSVSWLLLGEERPGPLVFEGAVKEGDMAHPHLPLDLEEQEIVLEVQKLLAVGNQALTRDLRQQIEWVKKVYAVQIERRTRRSERTYRPPAKKRVVGFGQGTE